MTEVGIWIRELFLMAAVLAFLECLIPRGGTGKFVRFTMAMVLLEVILHPLNQWL